MLMMLPFEAPTIFEGIHKSYFQMPRVVKDQRSKFENDDLFRQLSHESSVKYTGFKDRPLEERQMKFIANCQEGHTEVSVVQSGNQFTLMFNPTANPAYNNEGCDFDKELGKVHIKSGFILNGVCVLWRGWIDLQRLEGFGCLEFDEYRAYLEDAMLKQQIDKQQACNNNSLMNHQNSPLSRLNHHSLGAGVHLSAAAAAAAAVAANSLQPPVGLNPAACLGVGPPPLPPPQQQQQQQPPPPPPPHLQQGQLQNNSLNSAMQAPLPPTVSLADSAAHYGNAAIAAAAAAAFHQALSVGAPPVPISIQPSQPSSLAQSGPQSQQQSMQRLGHPSLAAPGLLSTGANQHLSGYTTNGIPNGNNSCILPSNQAMTASQSNTNNNRPSLNGSTSSSSSSISSSGGGVNKNNISPSHSPLNHHHTSSRSPERENHLNIHHQQQHHSHHHHQHQHQHQHHHQQQQQQQQQHQQPHNHHQRQSTKRNHEELTQIDDVDVVSDIHSHDLDFPPRRIFKSAPITTGAIHHHRATRRA